MSKKKEIKPGTIVSYMVPENIAIVVRREETKEPVPMGGVYSAVSLVTKNSWRRGHPLSLYRDLMKVIYEPKS